MEIIEGNYGKCYICDNMDKNVGLPSLKNKSWDLYLSDPPYNENFDAKREVNIEINYKDDLSDKEYQQKLFILWKEVKRITNFSIFTPGYKNIWFWFKWDKFDYIIWFNKKNTGMSRFAQLRWFEPILCYSEKPLKHIPLYGIYEIANSIHDQRINCGIKHPCPKGIRMWRQLIIDYKPISIIDPFLGSGTTAEVCEEIGIPWVGYEINSNYIQDIKTRIKRGILAHKNMNTESLGEY